MINVFMNFYIKLRQRIRSLKEEMEEPVDLRTGFSVLVNYFGLTAHIAVLFFVVLIINRYDLGNPKVEATLLMISLGFLLSPLISFGIRKLIGDRTYRRLMLVSIGIWVLAGANGIYMLICRDGMCHPMQIVQQWFH
jgi:hypothetical protein